MKRAVSWKGSQKTHSKRKSIL